MAGTIELQRLHLICDLSDRLANSWSEAATVMLDKFHVSPPPPTLLDVTHSGERSALPVTWTKPAPDLLESYANEKDATEDGACALAIAVVHHRGFRVRRRAHHGSGADLLMTRHGEPQNDFIKLEVSGVARGRELTSRLAQKVQQVQNGDLIRPGVAVVIGFEAAAVQMEHTR